MIKWVHLLPTTLGIDRGLTISATDSNNRAMSPPLFLASPMESPKCASGGYNVGPPDATSVKHVVAILGSRQKKIAKTHK